MAIVPSELDGAVATNDFPVFEIDIARVTAPYLRYCLFQPSMLRVYENLSRGSTNRRRLNVDKFLRLEIPLPENLDEQVKLTDALTTAESATHELQLAFGGMEEELGELVGSMLHSVFKS